MEGARFGNFPREKSGSRRSTRFFRRSRRAPYAAGEAIKTEEGGRAATRRAARRQTGVGGEAREVAGIERARQSASGE